MYVDFFLNKTWWYSTLFTWKLKKKKKKGKGTYIFAGCNLVYVFSICEDNVLSILPMLTWIVDEKQNQDKYCISNIMPSSILVSVLYILGSTLYKAHVLCLYLA